ncbi:MAG TPA: MlaD family protein [Thermoanaerobaculia bacterium]|nr:MlaD family protein [Thermoanaerobaculia bacterium]
MSSAAKVGAFMVATLIILGYLILRIEGTSFPGGEGPTREVTAVFDSISGLEKKARVSVAGVAVGEVTGIRLGPDGRARVTMRVRDDVRLRQGASARVASMGLLGEKYVEIDPGPADAPLIPSGPVRLEGSYVASIDDVTTQVSAIATDVKAITGSLRQTMAGPQGQQRLEDIVENVRIITAQVRDLIAANRANVDATMANVREISAQLRTEIPQLARSIDHVADSIAGTIDDNRPELRQVVENLRGLSADLRVTAENVNAITGQVKSGEGTVGKLIYSQEAHDRLTAALESVESGVTELKTTLTRAGRISLDLGMKADYYGGLEDGKSIEHFGGNSRSAVTLRLTPNPERNRFYNIELAEDPRGRRRDKVIQETVTDPATGASRTTVTRTTRFERDFVVSAQAGWHLGDWAVRLGLFDNAGGGGIDYQWNERLRITGEAFDFGKKRDPNPHVRLFTEYVVRREKPRTPTIFLSTGVDNPLNDTAWIFGGGIRWRDDDLKHLLGSVPR